MGKHIYVCYPIVNRCDTSDGDIIAYVDMTDPAESFTTMRKAVAFCKERQIYSKFMIAVELADKGLIADIKAGETKG